MQAEKICSCCKIPKPAEEFYTLTYKPTGKKWLSARCRKCTVKKSEGKRNKEAKRTYDIEYREKNKAKIRGWQKAYREKNKDKIVKSRTKYRKRKIDTLLPGYVAENCAKSMKLPVNEVKEVPGLIELYKTQMLLKRKIKGNASKK